MFCELTPSISCGIIPFTAGALLFRLKNIPVKFANAEFHKCNYEALIQNLFLAEGFAVGPDFVSLLCGAKSDFVYFQRFCLSLIW